MLYLHKIAQIRQINWILIYYKVQRSIYWSWFLPYIFIIAVFLFHTLLQSLSVKIQDDNLYIFAFAVAGIVGSSIAIIFIISTFILQSTSDLFSTQYLKKFINDPKEKRIFWCLVFLVMLACLTPVFLKEYGISILVGVLLFAFYLIYTLYRNMQNRMDPETTLRKIRDDAIENLNHTNRIFKKQTYDYMIQIQSQSENIQSKEFYLGQCYASNYEWTVPIIENVKYLYEIGLRLLSKNEINAFNLTLDYIVDIYTRRIQLKQGSFIRLPDGVLGPDLCKDEGFTAQILEYLQSIGNHVVQEKRKENVYYLLFIYKRLVTELLEIEYATINIDLDDLLPHNPREQQDILAENPLLDLTLSYYKRFVNQIIETNEGDWIWESINSTSNISNTVLTKTGNSFVYGIIDDLFDRLFVACYVDKNRHSFIVKIIETYFFHITIIWRKYSNYDLLWDKLFPGLKDKLLLRYSHGTNSSIDSIFVNFFTWQHSIVNDILKLEEQDQKQAISDFTVLIMQWSDFLLDIARDGGMGDKYSISNSYISSVRNNLKIIHVANNHKLQGMNLEALYAIQFSILGWYFQGFDRVDNSFLRPLDEILIMLMQEICTNLKSPIFDIDDVIRTYINLNQEHFEKVEFGIGLNHPRVIKKMIYLGLVLQKYDRLKNAKRVAVAVNDLNGRYIKMCQVDTRNFDKCYFCDEIQQAKDKLLSHNLVDMFTIMHTIEGVVLKEGIDEKVWDSFMQKIHCSHQTNQRSSKNNPTTTTTSPKNQE